VWWCGSFGSQAWNRDGRTWDGLERGVGGRRVEGK